MHELSYYWRVFFVIGYLSEPVAFRSLSTSSHEFLRIHSISVRNPSPVPSAWLSCCGQKHWYSVILQTSSALKLRRMCHMDYILLKLWYGTQCSEQNIQCMGCA